MSRTQLGLAAIAAIAVSAGCGDRDATTTRTDEKVTSDAADAARTENTDGDSKEFVEKAALSSQLEIRVSELAATKSQRADVKALAAMLVTDHTKAAAELKRLAGAAFTVPSALDGAHQMKFDDVNSAPADSFDRDYLDLLEESHEAAVARFTDYAEDGDNAGLKSFAAATAPVLQGHLEQVRNIREGFDPGDDMMGLGSGENTPSDTDDETTPD